MSLTVDATAKVRSFTLTARFTAPPGITVIRGPSASGKTLALRLVAGLLRADSGSVRFGDELWDSPPARWLAPELRGIGYAPQHASLWPHRTVREQLAVIAPRVALDATYAPFGIDALLDRSPLDLSGGERQRVALVRALVRRPRVVLLDEPWSALDTDARATVSLAVRDLVRSMGAVALLVTHDSEDARALADHTVTAKNGAVTDRC